MKYEQFIEDIKEGIEEIVKDRLSDGVVVIRNVTKNNNVSMEAVSIIRKDEKATPTIYLKEYYQQYKKGKTTETICREIFEIYLEGIKNFKQNINVQNLSDFEKIKDKIYYKLINYDMNKKLLSQVPHFKYLDMAIVFFMMIKCDKDGQATALIYNQHLIPWEINVEQLRDVALNNTWKKFPPQIKKMEDIISEMILKDILEDEDNKDECEECLDEDDDNIREEIEYGQFTYREMEDIIKEEVSNMKPDSDIDMYVLTNNIRFYGATCITYPHVIRDFANEHQSDVYIIPSSIHEVILIPGNKWERDKINEMITEVNTKELDEVEILSDHVYIYNREEDAIFC